MIRTTRRKLYSSGLVLALLAGAPLGWAVGTRRFELHKGKDFQGGDLKGVAIDSAGRVHAGLNLGALPLGDAQSVWSALPRSDGSILLGTGNEGKLLEVRGGSVKVLAPKKEAAEPKGKNALAALGKKPKGKSAEGEATA